MTTVRVAVAQAEVEPSLHAAIEKSVTLIAEAAKNGAMLVAFPET